MQQFIRWLLCCCAFGWLLPLGAQTNITRVEYYLDTDPGFGRATAVTIIPATNLANIAINLNPSALSTGVHVLGIRALNATGNWGTDNKLIFLKPYPVTTADTVTSRVSRVEYFVDTDPGYGRATAVAFTASTNLANIAINLNPTTLLTGVHVLGIRALNAKGQWCHDNKWIFLKPYSAVASDTVTSLLSRVEYYIDKDPGFGLGKSISIGSTKDLANISLNLNPDSLTEGVHVLGIRAVNAKGNWCHDNRWLFLKPYAQLGPDTTLFKLSKVEYYIDTDPGYGNGVPVAVNAVTGLADFKMPINITGLTLGNHKLFIRSIDAKGRWALDNLYTFSVTAALAAPALVINSVTAKTLCARDSLKVAYHATGTYNLGNIFSVQLSDSVGNFAGTPKVIGTYAGTGNSIVNCVLPNHVLNGTKYRLRIVSSNPVVIGLTGSDSLVIRDAPYAVTITGDSIVNISRVHAYSTPAIPGNTYQWLISAGSITPSANTASVLWNIAGQPQKLSLIQTNSYGCVGDTSYKLVNVYPVDIDSVKLSSLTPCPAFGITVTALASGAYPVGNNFTAQISDSAGSFTAPVTIGLLTSNFNAVKQLITISVVLPKGLFNSSKYKIRVIGSNPADTGVSYQTFVINKPNLGKDSAVQFCRGSRVNISTFYTTSGYTTVSWSTIRPDSVTVAGTYRLIVTNANGCRDTAVVTVTYFAKPTLGNDTTYKICQWTSGNITGLYNTSGYSSVVWSTARPDSVRLAGNYTLIVTNSFGCKDTAVVVLSYYAKPALGKDSAVFICAGTHINIRGFYDTTGFVSKVWSTPRPDSVVAGTYSLIVTNSFGCKDTANVVVTYFPVPLTPGVITSVGGVAAMCPGETKSYSIAAVSGASSYTWTPPVGSTITSGQGTMAITINYTAAFTISSPLKVVANNICTSGVARSLTIARNTALTPGVITGLAYGVCNSAAVSYSVANVAGRTYNWTFNTVNATVASGQGSNAITANFAVPYLTGILSVTASTTCGTSAAKTLTIKATPAAPVAITGVNTVCASQAGVPYSIAAISGATTYTWTGPTGSRVSDGVTTSAGTALTTTATAVTVNFGVTAGNLLARGNNTCGAGLSKSLPVTINCFAKDSKGTETIAEGNLLIVSVSPNPSSDQFTLIAHSTNTQPITIRVMDAVGKMLYTAKGNAEQSFRFGDNFSNGIYMIEVRQGDEVKMIKAVKGR